MSSLRRVPLLTYKITNSARWEDSSLFYFITCAVCHGENARQNASSGVEQRQATPSSVYLVNAYEAPSSGQIVYEKVFQVILMTEIFAK
jgi:hypothetical protein